MENWLRNRGDDRSANHIYRHMRRRDRGEGKKGIFARLGDWFLDWTIGYGTASYRLGIYFLLIIVATTWLFSRPEAAERTDGGHPVHLASADRTRFQTIALALRMNLPMLAFVAPQGWEPSSHWIVLRGRRLPVTYQTYALVLSGLNWILFPLFIASITGFVKKQQ